LSSEALEPEAFADVLHAVFGVRKEAAVEAARVAILRGWGGREQQEERARIAAGILLSRASEVGWRLLRERFSESPKRGAAIIKWSEERFSDGRWRPKFTEPETMASFFEWAVGTACLMSGPEPLEGVISVVSEREVLLNTSTEVLDDLVACGTRDAVEEVERLAMALPDRDDLRTALRLARDRYLDAAWCPWSIEQVRVWKLKGTNS
jgi:hypothetical protein